MSREVKAPVDTAFTMRLPKIELHAHLTGSITPQCLHEIWLQRMPLSPHLTIQDPLEAMSKDKSWDIQTFFPLFSSYIYELCSTKENIVYSTNAVLRDFADDGVVYLELRTTPRSSSSLSKKEYISTILECIRSFPRQDLMHTFLILSIDRRTTAEQAMEVVDLALKYRSSGVVGIDLCGDPSKGIVSTFQEAFHKAKSHGLKITLHFAEVPASFPMIELEKLLSYQPDRLGHVCHPPEAIKQEIVRRRLAVELCVSCNIQAKLTEGGVEDHHFGWWKDTGCPVVLCVSTCLVERRKEADC